MTRAEIDWIIGWGLLLTGERSIRWLRDDTHLNLPVMKRCQSCGIEMFSICVQCAYRNGSDLHEDRNLDYEDAVQGLQAIHQQPNRLFEIWNWMQATID